MSDAAAVSGSTKVRVVVRVRPLLPAERDSKDKASRDVCVTLEPTATPAVAGAAPPALAGGAGVVTVREPFEDSFGSKHCNSVSYGFDACYDASAPTRSLFENEIKPYIGPNHLFGGHSITVFTYGMTGTGKTHTMGGDASSPGLIPLSVEEVFRYIQTKSAAASAGASSSSSAAASAVVSDMSVSCSFLEIYNEKCYDLLEPKSGAELPLRENTSNQLVVAGLTEKPIPSADAFRALYAAGFLAIKISYKTTQTTRSQLQTKHYVSKLNLIDLAGNEDNRQSGNGGQRLVESGAINKSLFVLGNVINAINSGENRIPFRDSKLTRVLQDSLGGGHYSVMIANIAPTLKFACFTIRTLSFAAKGREIVNTPTATTTTVTTEIKRPDERPNSAGSSAAPTSAYQNANANLSAKELKAKLEAWKAAKNGGSAPATAAAVPAKKVAAAAASSTGAVRVPKAANASAGGSGLVLHDLDSVHQLVTASIASHAAATAAAADAPSGAGDTQLLLSRLDQLTEGLNQVAAAVKQQQQQQQQQQQKQSATAAAAAAATVAVASKVLKPAASIARAATSAVPPPPAPAIGLTPVSSAELAKVLIKKARLWEERSQWSNAFIEYTNAARLLPDNEKLKKRMAALQKKLATADATSAAPATVTATPVLLSGITLPPATSSTAAVVSAPSAGVASKRKSNETTTALASKAAEPATKKRKSNEKSAIAATSNGAAPAPAPALALSSAAAAPNSSRKRLRKRTAVVNYAPKPDDDDDDDDDNGGGDDDAKPAAGDGTDSELEIGADSEYEASDEDTKADATASPSASAAAHDSDADSDSDGFAIRKRKKKARAKAAKPAAPAAAAAAVSAPPPASADKENAVAAVPAKPKGRKPAAAKRAALAPIATNSVAAAVNATPATAVIVAVGTEKPAAAAAAAVPVAVAVAVAAATSDNDVFKKRMDGLMKNMISHDLLQVLNSGSLKQLKKLHLIGPKRAELIITTRATTPFQGLDDLRNIGMSEKMCSDFLKRNMMGELFQETAKKDSAATDSPPKPVIAAAPVAIA